MQIHQVTNKLLNPRVSAAIKKVLGALVGWNGKRVFVIRGSVAWWSERRCGSQELSDLGGLRGPAAGLQAALGLRRTGSPTLNLPSEELLTQGQELHSRKPDSLSAK